MEQGETIGRSTQWLGIIVEAALYFGVILPFLIVAAGVFLLVKYAGNTTYKQLAWTGIVGSIVSLALSYYLSSSLNFLFLTSPQALALSEFVFVAMYIFALVLAVYAAILAKNKHRNIFAGLISAAVILGILTVALVVELLTVSF